MDNRTVEIINALINVWTGLMRDMHTENDACILATRVGVEALAYFNVPAEPLSVAVVVQNRALYEAVDAKADMDWKNGEYGVGVDPELEPNDDHVRPNLVHGWNGHLVINVPKHKTIVDLTLDQFSRPQHDINVRPVVVRYDDDFLNGMSAGYAVDDCRVWFTLRPGELESGLTTVDGSADIKEWAGPTIRRMRKILWATNGQ